LGLRGNSGAGEEEWKGTRVFDFRQEGVRIDEGRAKQQRGHGRDVRDEIWGREGVRKWGWVDDLASNGSKLIGEGGISNGVRCFHAENGNLPVGVVVGIGKSEGLHAIEAGGEDLGNGG
jgi:hypothetical protein